MAPVGVVVAQHLDPEHRTPWRASVAQLAHKTAHAVRDVQDRRIFGSVLLVSIVVRLCKFGSYYFLVLAIMGPLGYTIDGLGFFRVFLRLHECALRQEADHLCLLSTTRRPPGGRRAQPPDIVERIQ